MIYEINGKKYVLIVDFVRSAEGLINCQQRIKKHKCILQRFEYTKAHVGIFADRSTNVYILVPEDRIMDFNDELIDLD